MENFSNHTFVVCAYEKSKYLEECIESLENQTIKSNIIISTSTPNEYIKEIAKKHNLPIYINDKKMGIGQDWNFGISKTTVDYVTIAHQDDIYEKNYLEEVKNRIEKYKDIVIIFTKYKEIQDSGEIIKLNKLVKIKEVLLIPFKFFKKSTAIKKFVLSFGNPICCPSVTLNKKIVGKRPFKTDLKCSLDWDTWLYLTKYKGKYIYIPKYLTYHRIHNESTTSKLVENNIREKEDKQMFEKFWPKVIANRILKIYLKSLNIYKKEEKR